MKIKSVLKNVFRSAEGKWYLITEAESELRCRECYEDFEEMYCFGTHNLCLNCCSCENKEFGDGEVLHTVWRRGKPEVARYAKHRTTSILKEETENYYGVKL